MHYLYVGSTTGSGGGNLSYVICVLCALYMLVGLIPVATVSQTVSRTTLWHRERRQWEEAAAAAGLDDLLPPPAKRKHRQHKVHEHQNSMHQARCHRKSGWLQGGWKLQTHIVQH